MHHQKNVKGQTFVMLAHHDTGIKVDSLYFLNKYLCVFFLSYSYYFGALRFKYINLQEKIYPQKSRYCVIFPDTDKNMEQ